MLSSADLEKRKLLLRDSAKTQTDWLCDLFFLRIKATLVLFVFFFFFGIQIHHTSTSPAIPLSHTRTFYTLALLHFCKPHNTAYNMTETATFAAGCFW